jgi:hypothetical protein
MAGEGEGGGSPSDREVHHAAQRAAGADQEGGGYNAVHCGSCEIQGSGGYEDGHSAGGDGKHDEERGERRVCCGPILNGGDDGI